MFKNFCHSRHTIAPQGVNIGSLDNYMGNIFCHSRHSIAPQGIDIK